MRQWFSTLIVPVVFATALSACRPEAIPVALDPGPSQPRGHTVLRPVVAAGPFVDKRGQGATYIGTIRGAFGEPVTRLHTTTPVSGLVREAFANGLKARGLLADEAAAPYKLSGEIVAFDTNQYIRGEADANVALTLTETRTGRVLAMWPAHVRERQGTVPVTTGSPAAYSVPEPLPQVASDALRRLVDEALDGPKFRDAIR
jgi:hypothetical protein